MVLVILGGVSLCAIMVLLALSNESGKAVIIAFLGVFSMLFFLRGAGDVENKAVKERLLKDKKIEWKVSNDGQPYLILKDSSLAETWKYLK